MEAQARPAPRSTWAPSTRAPSGADDVVNLERLIDLAEPFRPTGRAASPALIQRQLQLAQQARHLLPRRHMAEVGPGAQRGLVDVVERRQSARKELAINHALGETVDRAKTQPE